MLCDTSAGENQITPATANTASSATAPNGSWSVRTLRWGMWPLILTSPTILLHEGSHLAVATAVGVPEPVLHYSAIGHGDVSMVPGWAMALTGAAGPLMTLLLSFVGCWGIAIRRGSPWAFGLAATASSRLLLGVPFAVLGTISVMLGNDASSAFDEFKAANAVGLHGLPFVAATAAAGVAIWIFIGRRIPKGDRWAAWPGLILGTLFGWGLWLGVLGPILLP